MTKKFKEAAVAGFLMMAACQLPVQLDKHSASKVPGLSLIFENTDSPEIEVLTDIVVSGAMGLGMFCCGMTRRDPK